MRYLLVFLLLLTGACAAPMSPVGWLHHPSAEELDEIAYNASNNAILTKRFIAEINSKTPAEIVFFLNVTQHGWSETAFNIQKSVEEWENK